MLSVKALICSLVILSLILTISSSVISNILLSLFSRSTVLNSLGFLLNLQAWTDWIFNWSFLLLSCNWQGCTLIYCPPCFTKICLFSLPITIPGPFHSHLFFYKTHGLLVEILNCLQVEPLNELLDIILERQDSDIAFKCFLNKSFALSSIAGRSFTKADGRIGLCSKTNWFRL